MGIAVLSGPMDIGSLPRAGLAVALALMASAAMGGVTSSTDQHDFLVEGTTAASLVRFMNGHALSGDHGHAYASIHPDYQLTLATHDAGGICRPSGVDVHVQFDLTLPVAASPGAMSHRTRAAWSSFTAFARAHENHHRASYLGCASAFVAQARRQSGPSCLALQDEIRRMLYDMKRSCEVKQRPFDQSQARVLRNLALFALARR